MAEIPGSNLDELALSQAELVTLLNSHLWVLHCFRNGAEDYTPTPPGGPSNGNVYIIGDSATGVWTGKDYQVAIYIAGAWHYLDVPVEGWRLWVKDVNIYYRYDGSTWIIDDPDKVHQTITPAASVTINWSLGSNASLLLDRASTEIAMTGAYQGQRCMLTLIDDGTGGRGMTWTAVVRESDDLPLPATGPDSNESDMLGFQYNQDGNSKYDLTGIIRGF